MILVCYDGSVDAKAAISCGGELLGDQAAIVLTVWNPLVELLARAPSGFRFAADILDFDAIDDASRQSAEGRSAEGAALARKAGLLAEPLAREQGTTVADTILTEAAGRGASAILMGSRGLGGLKSMLLGSVSHAVVQHADRPVIIVPSPGVATSRARDRDRRQAT